jgi:branched-chain amino acid transport system substrate-binding protein
MADEYGIEIVADETYAPGDTDMTAQLVNIKNSGAQAVINWSIVPAQSIVPQNMKQLKMEIPLYQSHGFANVKYAEAAGEAAEGLIFPAGRIMAVDTLPEDAPQRDVLAAYKSAYESRYNDHVSTFGGHAYDALWLVVNALKAVGDDPAAIRDHIESAKFVGTGGVFQFSPDDHCGLDKTAFEMLTVKDGKFVVLGN